jgi:hypothetical protein
MNKCLHTELSSHEGTRSEFNPGKATIKLGIDVRQEFYVVVCQEGGSNSKPAQRFKNEAFLSWAARLKQKRFPVPLPPIALINSRKLSESIALRQWPHASRRLSGLDHKPNEQKEEEASQITL